MTKILSGKTLYLVVGVGTVIIGLLIGFLYGNITDTEIQQSNITISSGTSNSILPASFIFIMTFSASFLFTNIKNPIPQLKVFASSKREILALLWSH